MVCSSKRIRDPRSEIGYLGIFRAYTFRFTQMNIAPAMSRPCVAVRAMSKPHAIWNVKRRLWRREMVTCTMRTLHTGLSSNQQQQSLRTSRESLLLIFAQSRADRPCPTKEALGKVQPSSRTFPSTLLCLLIAVIGTISIWESGVVQPHIFIFGLVPPPEAGATPGMQCRNRGIPSCTI